MKAAAALASVVAGGLLTVGCTTDAVTAPAPTAPAGTVTPTPTHSATPPLSATTRQATPAAEPSTAPALTVTSVRNFRDVAGAGLALPDGGQMATGVVYRSAQLATASRADVARLGRSGIGLVIDLRTDTVSAHTPDPVIRGATHKLVNLYAVASTPAVHLRSVAAAETYMRDMNVHFVSVSAQRAKVGEALTLIARAKSPVLVHCTAGKDRTGWISALLQMVAGADRNQVMAEYLKSNTYNADVIKSSYQSTLASSGLTAARIKRATVEVKASYLNAGLSEMDRRYGGLDGYLTKGLGLSGATVATLRDRLTA